MEANKVRNKENGVYLSGGAADNSANYWGVCMGCIELDGEFVMVAEGAIFPHCAACGEEVSYEVEGVNEEVRLQIKELKGEFSTTNPKGD